MIRYVAASAEAHLKQEVIIASPNRAPLGFEVAFTTPDVPALYARAINEGAVSVSAPESKPWGQTVAYVRDPNGSLVEICPPLP